MFGNGYRGVAGGSVQNSYAEQPDQALPGMSAFASDNNAHDAIMIGETNGIACGRGVVYGQPANVTTLKQIPNVMAHLPQGTETAVNFAGIVMWDAACNSDENGVAGWADKRMARIMRPQRSGGRIWVKTREAVTMDDDVHWVIAAPVDESYEVGEFSPNALAGGDAGTSVALTNCAWVSEAEANSLAVIEMVGSIVEVTEIDESSF